jgi:hypothetical protein
MMVRLKYVKAKASLEGVALRSAAAGEDVAGVA